MQRPDCQQRVIEHIWSAVGSVADLCRIAQTAVQGKCRSSTPEQDPNVIELGQNEP
jgi:hypothetical protein